MKRTNQLHERNANERKTSERYTQTKWTKKRKQYEISVNLNDPGSVV